MIFPNTFFKKELDIISKDCIFDYIKKQEIENIFKPLILYIYENYDKKILGTNQQKNLKSGNKIGRYGYCENVSIDIINYLKEDLEKNGQKSIINNINNFIDNFNLGNINKIGLLKIDTIYLNNNYIDTYHIAVILGTSLGKYILVDFTGSQFNNEIHDREQYLPEFLISFNKIPKIYIDYSILPIYRIKYGEKDDDNIEIDTINNSSRIGKNISYHNLERFELYLNS